MRSLAPPLTEDVRQKDDVPGAWSPSIRHILLSSSIFAVIDIDVSGGIPLGELLVALATLALACVTVKLASSTKQSVQAAEENMEAMAMPYVVAVPVPAHDIKRDGYGADGPPNGIHRFPPGGGSHRDKVRARLLNVGSGPAIVRGVRLHWEDEEFLGVLLGDLPIAAKGHIEVSLPIVKWTPAEGTPATLTIKYLHSSGRGYETKSDVLLAGDDLVCTTYLRQRAPELDGASPN